jgi:hypothetical protein
MLASSQSTRTDNHPPGLRVLAGLCCLLLLLPALNVRPILLRASSLQESEESRQPTEEERSSEDTLDVRSGARRWVDLPKSGHISLFARGASSCRLAANSLMARAEHRLRNGVGAPLRC